MNKVNTQAALIILGTSWVMDSHGLAAFVSLALDSSLKICLGDTVLRHISTVHKWLLLHKVIHTGFNKVQWLR